jgi:hypothetical protein
MSWPAAEATMAYSCDLDDNEARPSAVAVARAVMTQESCWRWITNFMLGLCYFSISLHFSLFGLVQPFCNYMLFCPLVNHICFLYVFSISTSSVFANLFVCLLFFFLQLFSFS